MNNILFKSCFVGIMIACISCSHSKEQDTLVLLKKNSEKPYDTYIVMSDFDCTVCTEKLLSEMRTRLRSRKVKGLFYKPEQGKFSSFKQISGSTNSFIDWQPTSDSTIIFNLAKMTNSKKGPYVLERNSSDIKTYVLNY
jgi:hypothetical protein